MHRFVALAAGRPARRVRLRRRGCSHRRSSSARSTVQGVPGVPRALPQGHGARGRRSQRGGRRARPQDRDHFARRQRRAGRCRARRRGAADARKGDAADGHVRVERRPCRRRPREAAARSCSSPPSRSPTRSSGKAATSTRSGCAHRRTCRRRCSCRTPSRLGKKRWAIVYPNYEYGQAATAAFKQQMQAQQGAGLEFVEQAVPLGKIEPGAVVQALIDAQARRDLLVAVRPRSRALRARRASCAASSRIARCSTCWAASPSTSIR